MPRDFPTLRDGDALEPFHLNLIYDELRRWRRMTGDGQVEVENARSSSSPPVLRNTGYEWVTIARVTTNCPARSGSTYGAGGKVTFLVDDGADLADGSVTDYPAKNLVDKTLVAGANAYVLVGYALGSYWVLTPASCSMVT